MDKFSPRRFFLIISSYMVLKTSATFSLLLFLQVFSWFSCLKLCNLFLTALGLHRCMWATHQLPCAGFSSKRLLQSRSTGSRVCKLLQLQHLGSVVAPRHVGSSRTRDQTCVPCIARLIPRKVPRLLLVFLSSVFCGIICTHEEVGLLKWHGSPL